MRSRLIAVLAGLALPFTALAGETKAVAGGPIVVGMPVPGVGSQFYDAMKAEADRVAARLGARLDVKSAQWDAGKQDRAVTDLVKKGARGILVAPMNDSLVSAIETAVEAGVPVAVVETRVNTDKVLVQVLSDNAEGGREAARFIIEKLGDKGSVIEIEGGPGYYATGLRKAGFEEAISKSNLKLIASETANWQRNEAQSVMKDLIRKHPDFDAVFAANDEMIIGAIEAMSSAQIDVASKVTVGYDASPDAFKYMKAGKLTATIDQYGGKQAGQALELLVDYLENKMIPPEKIIFIRPELITKAP